MIAGRAPGGCLSDLELSLAYDAQREGVADTHLLTCTRCRERLAELEQLTTLGRAVPHVEPRPDAGAALVAWAAQNPVRARSLFPWRAAALVAAAASVVMVVSLLALEQEAADRGLERQAEVRGSADARYEHQISRLSADGARDETLRVEHGRVQVELKPLAAGERFRVLVSDADIEVLGTRLEVEVREGRLYEVQVIAGRAMVRARERPPASLDAGERWSPAPSRAEASAARAPAPVPAAPAVLPTSAPAAPAVLPTSVPAVPRIPPSSVARSESPAEPRSPRAEGASLPRARSSLLDAAAFGASAETAPIPPPPDAFEAEFGQAWSHFRAGELPEAAEGFAQVERGGSLALAEDAAYWRVVALLKLGAPDSEEMLARFLERHPASLRWGQLAITRAEQLLARGKKAEAWTLLRRAAQDPDHAIAESAERLRVLSGAPARE
ncbi:MAG: FecR domain-containing protein [Deltaproteobacteria bacterium]|nr:FecR domain-containing protein [Deltaproteobacteria bacterium]